MAEADALTLTETPDGVLVPVKVVPGASRDRIIGIHDGGLRIAVSAPPEKGRANQAVVALLARALGVRRSQLAVVQGMATPYKVIQARGVTADTVRGLLA